MRANTLFNEYVWLIETLRRYGKLSLKELSSKWENNIYLSDGRPLARSTFNRHIENIKETYNINIACDLDGYRYYIANPEILEDDSIQNWMLSTMSVNSLLSSSQDIRDRILLESIPSGGKFLHLLISAMKSNSTLRVSYRKFGSKKDSNYLVDPLFVKLFQRRWYVMVRDKTRGYIFPLALDRIVDISLTGEHFVFPEDFSPSLYMKEQYGVVIAEQDKLQKIVIRAFGSEADYLRTLPLHCSQSEIGSGEGWTDFELHLRLTQDFITPLVARGAKIRVLEPKFLAEEIMYQHDDATRLYTDEFELLEP